MRGSLMVSNESDDRKSAAISTRAVAVVHVPSLR
jgi:hypothetical protein